MLTIIGKRTECDYLLPSINYFIDHQKIKGRVALASRDCCNIPLRGKGQYLHPRLKDQTPVNKLVMFKK